MFRLYDIYDIFNQIKNREKTMLPLKQIQIYVVWKTSIYIKCPRRCVKSTHWWAIDLIFYATMAYFDKKKKKPKWNHPQDENSGPLPFGINWQLKSGFTYNGNNKKVARRISSRHWLGFIKNSRQSSFVL